MHKSSIEELIYSPTNYAYKNKLGVWIQGGNMWLNSRGISK